MFAEILLKKLTKNGEEASSPKVRSRCGIAAGIICIVCNILLCSAKIVFGILSASVSVVTDGINNLSDAASNIVSLVGFKMALRPADKEHPYGHGRYEYLSGMIVAVVILVFGIELLKTGIERAISPVEVHFSWVLVGILIASILVKFGMALLNRRLGKLIDSQTLAATAADSRNDVITTLAVLIATIISHYVDVDLDGYMAIAVALFIMYGGLKLVKETLDPLLGRAPDSKFVNAIKEKILSYDNVLGTHDLMVHDYGPGRQFASVHVEMSAELSPLYCHNIIDRMEHDFLEEQGLNLIVHLDPITPHNALRDLVETCLKAYDERITIHDFTVEYVGCNFHISLDCVVPEDLQVSAKELTDFVSERLATEYPNCVLDITVDSDFAALPHSI